jgi:GTP-binding protein
MWHTPIAFITGKTGKNVKALLNHAQMLFKQSRQRIGTGELNRLIRSALERHSPPVYQNKVPKIYYAAQIGIQPPTIVLVCNEPKAFSAEYRRYLLGALRDHVPFAEIPIKLYLHRRSRASAVEAPPPEEWIEPDEETALSE